LGKSENKFSKAGVVRDSAKQELSGIHFFATNLPTRDMIGLQAFIFLTTNLPTRHMKALGLQL